MPIPHVLTSMLLVAGLCVLPARAAAHELGTTRVTAAFAPDRSYSIVVVTDAQALVEKLESVAAVPVDAATPADADPARLETALHRWQDTLWTRMAVAFDGETNRPALSIRVARSDDLAAPALAYVTLDGRHAPAARYFTWQYGWTFATYTLSLRRAGGVDPAVQWLEGGEKSAALPIAAVPPAPTRGTDTVRRYLWLGFTHIVPLGLDHVLFVLGLFLLDRRARPLLLQVSAFTVAHSITLALALRGVIAVPAHIVEPLIALSIAYVAIENLLVSEVKSWRLALVFACGLLHGLGFAGVLSELGLPPGEFLAALLSFNLGVEVAQLSIVAAAWLMLGWSASHRDWYRERIVVPASLMIACVGIYWALARM